MWTYISSEQWQKQRKCSQPEVAFDIEKEGIPTQISKGRQLLNKTF